MVIDYQKINEDTDQDAYPLPVIDDILDQLGRVKFFLAFDVLAEFHLLLRNNFIAQINFVLILILFISILTFFYYYIVPFKTL